MLTRFDAKTGRIGYRSRLGRRRRFTSSPWAYNDRIYCLSEEGQTFVVAAGDTFTLLHVNGLGEMAQASPAIVGERLLLRTEPPCYRCVSRVQKPARIASQKAMVDLSASRSSGGKATAREESDETRIVPIGVPLGVDG